MRLTLVRSADYSQRWPAVAVCVAGSDNCRLNISYLWRDAAREIAGLNLCYLLLRTAVEPGLEKNPDSPAGST